MSMHKTSHRVIALLLTLVMLLSVLPMGVFAAEGETVKGESTVVDANGAIAVQREVNFNKDWKFYLGDNSAAANKNFDDSAWTDVDLPHDFSIIQNFTGSGEAESGFLPGGTGWYRKTFVLPLEADGQSVLLNFDGVYMHAYVYVNGQSIGEHHFGYSNFAFDITDYLICDGATENVVSVKAVNNIPSSRWYSGSGIYRDVTLIMTDPVHVDLHGTHVTTPNIASGNGKVNVEVDVVNDGEKEVTATVKNTVFYNDEAVANAQSDVTVAAGAVVTATNAPVVANPALWSLEAPNLYTVKTEVIVGGKVVDTYATEFGFRWFSWSNQGFALNGKNVKLNGVCLHHDQGAAGSAAYYDAMYRQISIMKDMGCNAIRTSHNPADEHFIEICNKLGMLVIEESFDGITAAKNGNTHDFANYFKQSANSGLYGVEDGMLCSEYSVRSIVKRDRNAPAVFAWSYGNEIQEGAWADPQFVTYCEQYINWTSEEDGTRIVTIGDNSKAENSVLQQVITKILNAGGVAGFNYHCHQANSQSLVDNWGGQWDCILASETSSHVNSRGFYKNQASASTAYGYHLTSYDTSAVGWGDTGHDSMYDTLTKDYIAGEFVWTGFDYIGEPTPWNGVYGGDSGRGAVPNSAYFGIVETTGFEKDTYYLYRAQWNKAETTLHLVTAWDSDNYMLTPDGKTPVWVYTNAPVVKLYRNGEHIGTTTRTVNTTAAGHVYYTYRTETVDSSVCSVQSQSGADSLYSIFNVAYEAGTLSAKAFDEKGNEITLSGNSGNNSVSTPGAVSMLAISQSRTEAPADSYSLIYVEVDVTDANGNLDTTASNNITFTVEGPGVIVGVDNGDQATTKKYQNASVKTSATTANINAYAGKALVIVRTTEDDGEIKIHVASSGLTGGTAVVDAVEVENNETTGLQTYTMVRDYSVHEGVNPTLDTTATGTMADGTTVSGTIAWDEVSEEIYGTTGDHTITGTLTFPGQPPVKVTARLHVIPNVIAVRNISMATSTGVVPTLPNTVKGILADGTLVNEFEVKWDEVTADDLATVDDLVVVNGVATILGDETLPVTCTIRVAELIESGTENIAPAADGLKQDVPAGSQSDKLESVNNGITKPGDNTNERWTNWNYRTTKDNATITMTWATAHLITSVDLYYYYDNCCAKPSKVEFFYSNDMTNYSAIGSTETQVETYNNGAHFRYTFANPVDPVGLQVKLTQQSGTTGNNCVGLTEIEVNSARFVIEPNTTADLSGITVDGTAIPGFVGNVLSYVVEDGEKVEATTDKNVGITVLPEYQGVIRILTISEDGSVAQTYAITVDEAAIEWEEESIALKVGETKVIKIETGNYADLFDDTGLEKTIADVKVEGVTTTAGKNLSDAVTTLENGNYILVNNRADKPMTNENASIAAGGGTAYGRALSGSVNDMADNAIWILTKVSDGVYTVQDAAGKYLSIANNSASMVDTAAELDIVYTGSYWTISEDEAYLNDSAEGKTCAAGWKGNGASTDAGSKWSIYKVDITEDENSTTITIEGKSAGETSFTIGTTRYNIKVTVDEPVVLTLDYNDGVTPNKEITLSKGDKLGELPVPTRDRYIFEGWFYGETEVTAETVIEGDMTITAKWTEKPAVIELRNVSTATRIGVVPELPATVRGVLANGTLAGEFAVTWGTVNAADLVAGAIVTVTGTVEETDIYGNPMDVTCTIRVADAAPASSTNVGLNATVTQDIPQGYWSDNLASVNDGNTQSEADHQGEFNTHWSNYNYRNISNKATLTFTWDTVQSLKEFYIFFRVDNWSADLPADVEITYSVDGFEFLEMSHENSDMLEAVEYGGKYSYVLDQPINAKVVKFTFTQQDGMKVETKCVAVYEIQCMTVNAEDALILNSFASLSAITADGTAIEGFSSEQTQYEIPGDADTVIGAATEVNAGITVLPIYEGVVRILTVSEDGAAEKTYEITYSCAHENTEVRDAADATCEEPGYTGDTWCLDCQTKIETGTEIPAKGHDYGEPVFAWAEDNTASATVVCANDETHVVELEAEVTSETTKGDCQTKATTTYTATVTFEDETYTDTKVVEGELGDHTGDANKDHNCDKCGKPVSECADADKDHKCDLCGKTLTECADADKNHKCDVCGKTLTECVDENKDYKCDICGKELEKPEDPTDPEQPEQPEQPVIEDVIRLAGANRWETSLKVADEMKANLGLEKFDSIIIASGNDFADALAGSYLSTVKNAPILLGWGKGGKYITLDEANIAYIKANLAEGGTVYILGGKNAVPELYENELKGFKVVRLGGANRFETNLLILEEAGVAEGAEILVCTSTNFADSLSASATAKPILLVFNEYGKLYGKQPEFLAGLKNCTFTVIGGESAVSADLAKAIESYGKVERLAGANRFETSVLVAQKYFASPETAVLAYAWNYPDGLCGGSLAFSLKAPLILTMTKYEAKAVEYAKNAGIEIGLVLGGDTLISDDAVRSIFAMDKADEIIVK